MIFINFLFGSTASIISILLLAACFYFTLTYFEHLKLGNERMIKRSRLFAVLSFILAIGVPSLVQTFIAFSMQF